MDKFFGLKTNGPTVQREFVAGATTFFTMAYIMFVNPTILSNTGMSWGGVFVATILATVVGTLIMGLIANVPYAVAPGMGLNAFFTFTVCIGLGFAWQEALAMVFICGIVNIIITVTKLRKAIIKAIPKSLQLAIGGGIGLFIAYIGLKNAGFLNYVYDVIITPNTFTIPLGNIIIAPGYSMAGADIVPELVHFNNLGALLALIGLVIIVTLMLLKVKALCSSALLARQ
jgi:AGZA family xanthine/uracil permease-like MFS transporter